MCHRLGIHSEQSLHSLGSLSKRQETKLISKLYANRGKILQKNETKLGDGKGWEYFVCVAD